MKQQATDAAVNLDNMESLIDELEEALSHGKRMPFVRGLLIDEDRLLDILDRMRLSVPEEVKHARRLLLERDTILSDARAQVERSMTEEGLQEALEEEQQRILQQAEYDAVQIRQGADSYARQVLEDLDKRLGVLLTSVRNGLETLAKTQQ